MSGRGSAPAVLVGAFAVLVAVWSWVTPFGGTPDELDHHLRAISIGRGELVGAEGPPAPPRPPSAVCCDVGNPSAAHWVAVGVRLVTVPGRLDPATLPCDEVVQSIRTECDAPAASDGVERMTAMGTIEAVGYLPGAVATRAAGDAETALRLARWSTGAAAVLLVGLGVVALWRAAPAWPTLLGVAGGLSPMVAFLLASPSPNALEIAGAVAFTGGATLVAARGDVPRVGWVAATAGGFVLAASRSLGPVWVLAIGAVVLLGAEPGSLRRRLSTDRAPVLMAAALVVVGAVLTVGWEVVVQPSVPLDLGATVREIPTTRNALARVNREHVGVFGDVDIELPRWAYAAWNAVEVALLGAVAWFGDRRARRAVAAAAVLVLGAHALVTAAVTRPNGFDIQARHVLPVVVAAALVAGHHLARSPAAARRAVAGPVLGIVGVVAVVHVVALGTALAAYRVEGGRLVRRPDAGSWPTALADRPAPAALAVAAAIAAAAAVGATVLTRRGAEPPA